MKNKSMTLFWGLLLTAMPALADTDIMGEKVIALQGRPGQVQVTTRKIEGKLGRPFTIELKVNCQGDKITWASLPVSDSESVCDVKAHSAKLTPDGKSISMTIRETDAEEFNTSSRATAPAVHGTKAPRCQKAAKTFLFSVEDYCR